MAGKSGMISSHTQEIQHDISRKSGYVKYFRYRVDYPDLFWYYCNGVTNKVINSVTNMLEGGPVLTDREQDTREKLLKNTLELIKTEEDFSKITVRRIISNAGVSLSAVNYHFGSKERLINEVIRIPIVQYLSSQPNPYELYKGEPVKILKESIKLPAAYLAENPNISRVSILTDMSEPMENDLSVQTMEYWRPAIKMVFPEISNEETGAILWEILSTIQAAFVRDKNFKRQTGIDFFDRKAREGFIDKLVDSLVGRLG